MPQINQIVVLYAKPGRETALRDSLSALVAPSRTEQGNLRYELYCDANDARRFIFIERWVSAEAQQQHHNHGPHIAFFHEHGDVDVARRENFFVMDLIA